MTRSKYHHLSLIIGGVSMIILLVMAAVLYVERTTFIDNPFQIFLMIQDQEIVVMAGRYPSVVVRWLPFWVMKSGGSISLIMMAFSMSYMLFQSLMYYLVAIRLKRPTLAMIIPIMLAVSNADGFYWCNSELIQAISVALLAYAVYKSDMSSWERRILAVILIVTSLFFHPLSVVILVFLLAYEMRWDRLDKDLIALLTISVVGFVAKKILLPNWYDTLKSDSFMVNLDKYLSHIWDITSLNTFIKMPHVWPILGMLLVGSVILMRRRSYYRLLVTLGSFITYLVLVSLSDPDMPYRFYTEVNHTPLLIIAAWPMIYEVYQSKSKWVLYIIAGFMCIGLLNISLRSKHYSDRYEYYVSTLSNQQDDHYYIDKDYVPSNLIDMEWASPYESLIISTHQGDSKTLYIRPDDKKLNKSTPTEFIGTFKTYDPLNADYFDLDEGNYQYLDD